MSEYREDAKRLLELVGGKENIASVWHCATRMRFVLSDSSKADVAAIEELPSVRGTFTQAGQFQVIIGNTVNEFFKEFQAVSGIEESSKADLKREAESNQNAFQKALSFLSDVFTPIIPAFIVGGLILGFRNFIGDIPFEALGGTIAESSPFWQGLYDFLWLPGEAIFHFLPVHITWSVVKKMGGTEVLGIILGIGLVSGQLLNAYGAPDAIIAGEVPVWDFGSFQIQKIGYQGQVLPALFAGLAQGWLERFWRKHVPEYLSMILVPFLSLIPALILAHTILGPVGWKIGTWIGSLVYQGLTSSFSWLFGLVFGSLYAPLVITGLHHMTNAVDAQLIADYQGTGLWPMIALSNIAQASAVLAYWWMTRHDERENQITIPAIISAYMGVTEPALFGVTLKRVYPMIAAMIGSGIAGLVATLTKVTANSIGVGGLPGFLVIQPQSMLWFFICMAIAIVVPFVLTLTFRKAGLFVTEKEQVEQAAAPQTTASTERGTSEKLAFEVEVIATPADGEVIALDEVEDEVFSQKMMGEGFAVRPTSQAIYAPIKGTVTSVFPSKHAIGISGSNETDVLIHMGLDTVDLEGKPFEVLVQEGDTVDIGVEIARMDLDAVKAAGKGTDIVVVFTESSQVERMEVSDYGKHEASDIIGEYKPKDHFSD